MSNVTVLGMGAMGSRMARNLLDAGHSVTVWNRTETRTGPLVEAGASAAETPSAAVRDAELVISIVRDDEASRAVWLDPGTGALEAIPEQAMAIESSTITVGWARELAKRFEERGISFIDAPVLGSRPQAEAAELIYFTGGESDVVERARPILSALGSAIHHAGPSGSGAAIKLMVNAMLTMQIAALGELLGLVREFGIGAEKAVEIFSATPVCSPAAKGAAGKIVSRDHSPLFPVELVEKDLGYVVSSAGDRGQEVPLSEAARRIFAEALEKGLGEENSTAVALLYE